MADITQQNAQAIVLSLPYARRLGVRVDRVAGGVAVLSMPYDPALIGDPDTKVIHGGAVFALMDTAGGAAVMSHPDTTGTTATLDLRIDYMRPAIPGQAITAKAECYNVTRSVAFVRATAFDAEEARPVATAHGAFTVGKVA